MAPQSICKTTPTAIAMMASTVLMTPSVAWSELLRVMKVIATRNSSILHVKSAVGRLGKIINLKPGVPDKRSELTYK